MHDISLFYALHNKIITMFLYHSYARSHRKKHSFIKMSQKGEDIELEMEIKNMD